MGGLVCRGGRGGVTGRRVTRSTIIETFVEFDRYLAKIGYNKEQTTTTTAEAFALGQIVSWGVGRSGCLQNACLSPLQ